MVDPLLVGAATALGPGLLVLYRLMGRYEDLFDQARFFFALVVGLFVGILTAFFEMQLFLFPFAQFQADAGVLQSFLWSVLGYALFETGLKAIVIGLGRFRNRRDTPFYGVPLGLSMGAMMAVQMIAFQLSVSEVQGTPFTWLTFIPMAAVPVGAMLTHAAAAVWVGKGAADGSLGKGWATGMALQVPALATLWLWWQGLGDGGAGMGLPAVMGLGYGFLLLWITRKRVLDNVVPQEIRDQVRRQARRAQRQSGRGDGGETAAGGGSKAVVAGAASAAALPQQGAPPGTDAGSTAVGIGPAETEEARQPSGASPGSAAPDAPPSATGGTATPGAPGKDSEE